MALRKSFRILGRSRSPFTVNRSLLHRSLFTLFCLLYPTTLHAQLAGRWDSYHLRHDALHYDIALILPDTGSFIRVEATIRWKLSAAAPIRLELDSAMTLRGVMVNGT